MCAIIGVVLFSPDQNDFDLIKELFIQSSIRGLHATGYSYVKSGVMETRKGPERASEFLSNKHFSDCVDRDSIHLIGHCRYSTSDLEFNQPIANKKISIVHNGVISQESPEKWKELYGYDCQTKNDSELILQSINANKSPMIEFTDSSIAACELHSDKSFYFYRNGKRPLYYALHSKGIVVSSTKDILIRTNLSNIHSTVAGYRNKFDVELISTKEIEIEDLQYKNAL
jgi:glutamine phosphoribosylpyrophosphate amidotransferase